jgi:hypothetical protein
MKKLIIHMSWITSKRWFNDWDLLTDFFDSYPPLETRCTRLYKLISHLCSKLDQKVVLDVICITSHNPARAITIDWVEVDVYNNDIEHKLNPEFFELTAEEILQLIK